MNERLLEVKKLEVTFRTLAGKVKGVADVGFTMETGETLGIVGESGGGKSCVSLAIMGLIPNPPGEITSGEINFNGVNLRGLSSDEIRKFRGSRISMIFQEPMTSLNPIHKCGKQIREPILLHTAHSKKEADRLCVHLLSQVGIPTPQHVFNMYPHQLSGGMRQRVMIAMALACKPKLLIADEPTTALDVTIEAQIVELLKKLKTEINTAILLITHNLGLVAELCERVIVMYTGYCMEISRVKDLIKDPLHPYTKGLLRSIPKITGGGRRLSPIVGSVSNPVRMPAGCSFHPRCSEVMSVCKKTLPELIKIEGGRSVRCWKYA